jgi:hypothetical protein
MTARAMHRARAAEWLRRAVLAVVALAALLALAGAARVTRAVGAEVPEWHLEQPSPPPPAAGVEGSSTPIGLGHVGDVEFFKGNLGLLVTAGNGSAIPPGVWVYNGEGWHELAEVCGATDGRIAWAGEKEFWTVSDGRPGQAANGQGQFPPLEDNTLCHFAGGAVAGSYASLGFKASSYQAMHGAACLSPSECWFAGGPLPAPLLGSFHLRWNGTALEAEPNAGAYSVRDLKAVEGHLLESIGLQLEEAGETERTGEEILHPTLISEITTAGFVALHPRSTPNRAHLPEYAVGSLPQALDYLHLSADGGSLWAAAGRVLNPPRENPTPGGLTVLHRDAEGNWTQVLGPESEGGEGVRLDPANLLEKGVASIAAEPGTASAWLALDSPSDIKNPSTTATALVAHVGADGSISEQELPSAAERSEGVDPKGAASRIFCPEEADCWLATTQGWLFHLSLPSKRKLPLDSDPAFNGPLITSRPQDQGLPQLPPDTIPIDNSGSEELVRSEPLPGERPQPRKVQVPLISHVHSRLIHGSTLELRFHLAVRTRLRLIAQRRRTVVARTSMRTLKAGNRSLTLRLDPKRWPTKLNLETHPLAPLPTVTQTGPIQESVTSTSLVFPAAGARGLAWPGPSL